MNERIVYINDDGGVSIVIPSGEYDIRHVATHDVPIGKPYKIIDASEIPSDRTERDAWTVDVSDLTDGIGGQV